MLTKKEILNYNILQEKLSIFPTSNCRWGVCDANQNLENWSILVPRGKDIRLVAASESLRDRAFSVNVRYKEKGDKQE